MILIGCSAVMSFIRGSLRRFPAVRCVFLLFVMSSCCLANPLVLADATEAPEERLLPHEKALVEGDCRTDRVIAATNMLRISKEDLAVAKKSRKVPSVVLMLMWHELISGVDDRVEDGTKPIVLGSRLESWGNVIREQLQIEPPASWLWYCRESQLVDGGLFGPLADYSSKARKVSTTESPGVSWIEDPVVKGDVAASIRMAAGDDKTEVVRLPKEVLAGLIERGGFYNGGNVSAAIRDDQLFVLIPTLRNAFPIGHELYCLRILDGHNKQLSVVETVWHKTVCNAWGHTAWPSQGGRVLVVTELRIGTNDVFVFSAFPRTVSIESLGRKEGDCHATFSHLPGLHWKEAQHRDETSLPKSEDHEKATNIDSPAEKTGSNDADNCHIETQER